MDIISSGKIQSIFGKTKSSNKSKPFNIKESRYVSFRDLNYVVQQYADSATASELIDVVLEIYFADNLTLADAQFVFAVNKAITDITGVSENHVLSIGKIFGDSSTASDLVTNINTQKVFADTANAEDLVGVPDGLTYQFVKASADTASANESLAYSLSQIPDEIVIRAVDSPSIGFSTPQADSAQATESIDVLYIIGVNPQDSAQATEGLVFAIGVNPSDTATITESLNYSLAQVLADTGTTSDTPALATSRPAADSASVSDNDIISFGKNPSDTQTVTESLGPFAIGKVIGDTGTTSDTPALAISLPTFADSASAIEDLDLAVGRDVSDSVSATDSPVITSGTSFSDSLTISEAHVLAFSKARSDSVSAAESLVTLTNKGPSDTVNMTESPVFAIAQTLTDSAAISQAGGIVSTDYFAADFVVLSGDNAYNAKVARTF